MGYVRGANCFIILLRTTHSVNNMLCWNSKDLVSLGFIKKLLSQTYWYFISYFLKEILIPHTFKTYMKQWYNKAHSMCVFVSVHFCSSLIHRPIPKPYVLIDSPITLGWLQKYKTFKLRKKNELNLFAQTENFPPRN